MRVIVTLAGGSSDDERTAAERELQASGFVPDASKHRLAAMGMLAGELAEPEFKRLSERANRGAIRGIASLAADQPKRAI